MKGKHHKHPPIKRPKRGLFHRVEWAIYGTNCGTISDLVSTVQAGLISDYKILYVDADHNVEEMKTTFQVGKKQYHLPTAITWNEYDDKLQPWQVDATLVNGNHYTADRQIVILDPKKKDSLQRRIDQLTAVDLIITLDSETDVYGFLEDKITDATVKLHIDSPEQIIAYIKENIRLSQPSLKAVILAGGKSQRMGIDKSELTYHNAAQQVHIANICKKIGLETYISKSHDYENDLINDYPVLKDRFIELGPFGAICTAMMHDPDAAWLVLACDLPFLDEVTIKHLIDQRKFNASATAYKLSDQKFPEPLIAIYEPRSYQRMLRFLSMGYACPRKVLINSDTHVISMKNEKAAYNANTPLEREEAIKTINS